MAGEGSVDRSKMKQYLVPAVGVAALVLLVGLVAFVSSADGRKMSDGSNGSVDDPELKEITPGVKYRDLKVGEGADCPPGAQVTIQYTGWLTDGTAFDSGKHTFDLSGLIKGWQEGIPGMKKGGIRKLVISSDKGYGTRGSPPRIPGGATLIFEVNLIDFKAPRPRRSADKVDLTKLTDGTAPGVEDLKLIPIGDTGVKYRDLKVGDGAECPPDAHVIMDYTGWLTNGTMFDSSFKPGAEPLNMSLGGLIKGWQKGVPGMRVGGIRKLVIPPELGYGKRGSPPTIPPNATLVFEIELLGVK